MKRGPLLPIELILMILSSSLFLHHPAPTEPYTLSLHDALPILNGDVFPGRSDRAGRRLQQIDPEGVDVLDRKSTRLNSSHTVISYAVFCLKKKTDRSALPATYSSRAPENRTWQAQRAREAATRY